MKLFDNLNSAEKEMFLKFPAYVSLLTANSDVKMNEVERKKTIKFDHINTYTFSPGLSAFYEEAERVFQKNINELDKQLPKDKIEREIAINKELAKLSAVLAKLGKEHIRHVKKDIESYKSHVSKVHNIS